MAGITVETFGTSGGFTARDVLVLVPELLFLAFVATVALYSTVRLVASVRSGKWYQQHRGSGGARALLLSAAGVAASAAVVIPTLLFSLKMVLGAPVGVIFVAAAEAAAMVALAIVAAVVAVAMVSMAVRASVAVLGRIDLWKL